MRASERYRQMVEEEARRHGIKVQYHEKGAQWGRAALEWKRVFIPTPKTFTSFFTGLHELGHIIMGHKARDGKPEYLWEYEAFNWALEFCKKAGVNVPGRTVNYERDMIAEKLRESAQHRKTKAVDTVVSRFVREGRNNDADVKWVRKNIDDNGRVNIRAN